MNNIAYDLDSTLVNLEKAIKEKIFDKYNLTYVAPIDWNFSNYPEYLKKEILESFQKKDFMCNLEPFPNAINLINQLKEENNNIIIITARNKDIEKETILFAENLFNIPCYVVNPNQSKLDVMKKHNVELFVDDCPNNLLEYEEAGIKCIMISNDDTPYNHHLRDKIYWVKDVSDLYDKFQYLNIFNILHCYKTIHTNKMKLYKK